MPEIAHTLADYFGALDLESLEVKTLSGGVGIVPAGVDAR